MLTRIVTARIIKAVLSEVGLLTNTSWFKAFIQYTNSTIEAGVIQTRSNTAIYSGKRWKTFTFDLTCLNVYSAFSAILTSKKPTHDFGNIDIVWSRLLEIHKNLYAHSYASIIISSYLVGHCCY